MRAQRQSWVLHIPVVSVGVHFPPLTLPLVSFEAFAGTVSSFTWMSFPLVSNLHLLTAGSEECGEMDVAMSRGCWRRVAGDFDIGRSKTSALVKTWAFYVFSPLCS